MVDITEKPTDSREWLGFSLGGLLMVLVGIIALGFYIGVLFFGENSVLVTNRLTKEKQMLETRRTELKNSSQKLQKEYFELLQSTQ